jgi:hypothetical protein
LVNPFEEARSLDMGDVSESTILIATRNLCSNSDIRIKINPEVNLDLVSDFLDRVRFV